MRLHGVPALALTGLLVVPGSPLAAPTDPLSKIGHIVMIFEENRSFDTMFGDFPDANGRANAGDAARQVDPNGVPYQFLPPVMNTNERPPVVDTRFPARLPNGPFDIAPYVRPNAETGDLVHRFYQEQMQINGGAMNRYGAGCLRRRRAGDGLLRPARHQSVAPRARVHACRQHVPLRVRRLLP